MAQENFGLSELTMVGDCGIITNALIKDLCTRAGMSWIIAAIADLASDKDANRNSSDKLPVRSFRDLLEHPGQCHDRSSFHGGDIEQLDGGTAVTSARSHVRAVARWTAKRFHLAARAPPEQLKGST